MLCITTAYNYVAAGVLNSYVYSFNYVEFTWLGTLVPGEDNVSEGGHTPGHKGFSRVAG